MAHDDWMIECPHCNSLERERYRPRRCRDCGKIVEPPTPRSPEDQALIAAIAQRFAPYVADVITARERRRHCSEYVNLESLACTLFKYERLARHTILTIEGDELEQCVFCGRETATRHGEIAHLDICPFSLALYALEDNGV